MTEIGEYKKSTVLGNTNGPADHEFKAKTQSAQLHNFPGGIQPHTCRRQEELKAGFNQYSISP